MNTNKDCKDCAHSDDNSGQGWHDGPICCMRPCTAEEGSGFHHFNRCSDERSGQWKNSCGPSGQYFRPKSP